MFARLILSPDQRVDATDPLLGFSSQRINIPAGGSKTITFNFKTPPGLAPGTYLFLANVGPDASLRDTDPTDNAVSGQVTIG
jgi:hypothetical protein